MTVHRKPEGDSRLQRYPAWKLEDAKARLSEVVRKARAEGPQRVTHRGQDAVVVISAAELERLLPPERPKPSLMEFLQGTELYKLDITRLRRGRRKSPL
jgi:antitoxin Phd